MVLRQSARFRNSRKIPGVVSLALLLVAVAGTAAVSSSSPAGTSDSPVPAIQVSMTLKCNITSFTMTTGDSKDIKTENRPASAPLTFTVVDGQLGYVAPAGAGKLRLLSASPYSGSMYFEELTGERSIVLWAFHRLRNARVLFSEQLSINNSGQIEIWTQAGYCDATGGNGTPVRK